MEGIGAAASTAAIDAATQAGIIPSDSGISSYLGDFASILQGIGSRAGTAGVESAVMPFELVGLLEMQRQMQIEMESVSLISNIEKARHESKMSAVRNIRTS